MKTEHQYFLQTFAKAVIDGTAGVFIGAGLSQPSGFVNWKELLRETAEHLGLSVDRETDLIAVAQYHVNHHCSRGHINQLLVDEFTRDAQLTENHGLLASMPIDTIWTTNYDDLLVRLFGFH